MWLYVRQDMSSKQIKLKSTENEAFEEFFVVINLRKKSVFFAAITIQVKIQFYLTYTLLVKL